MDHRGYISSLANITSSNSSTLQIYGYPHVAVLVNNNPCRYHHLAVPLLTRSVDCKVI